MVALIAIGDMAITKYYNKKMKKVSIMLPDYNGGELVRRSIESVLAQTYTDYVLYLIDNGSTKDNTREILHSYTDPRIVHIDVDVNNGTSSAYNAVLNRITTKWVAIIHADDMWYPTKLEKQMAFLEKHPDYCILGTWYDFIDINDKVIGTSKEPLTSWEKVEERYKKDKLVVFCHPSVVFNRDIALAVGGFHEEFWPTDDADMWSRMLETGGKACIYPEVLTMYRMHGASTSYTRMSDLNEKRRFTQCCMKLRRKGLPEISFDEFKQQRKKRPLTVRSAEAYQDYTQYHYKMAIGALAAKKWGAFVLHGVVCSLMNPVMMIDALTKKSMKR